MVYGAMGIGYKSKLIFCKSNITSEVYAGNILDSQMFNDLKDKNFYFMQDGAPSHTSHDILQWLHHYCSYIKFWPANSPDLNPIEMIWAIIKSHISALPASSQPKNIIELEVIVRQIWDSIPQETINRLVESFYYRLILVAEHNGNSIQQFIRHNICNDNLKEKAAIIVQSVDIEIKNINEIICYQDPESPLSTNFFPFQESIPVVKKRWTKEEDLILLRYFHQIGPKWSSIAKVVGRSPSSVKNRWQTHLSKKLLELPEELIFPSL